MPKGKGTARAIRAAKKREPQLVEPERHLLALRGPSSSALAVRALRDLVALKKPAARLLARRNDVAPFESAESLEFLMRKNDAAAFALVSHNKKRPHNLVLGRTYDGALLDAVEAGIDADAFRALADIPGPKKLLGARPLMVFSGEDWERAPALGRLRSLLLDAFGLTDGTAKLALTAVDHVIVATAVPPPPGAPPPSPGAAAGWPGGRVLLRVYTVVLTRSPASAGGALPGVALLPHGPSLDLALRRVLAPPPDVEREARRAPAALKPKKVKNVAHNAFGDTLGRLHMERQDFAGLRLARTKGGAADRKAARRERAGAGAGAGGGAGAGAGAAGEGGAEGEVAAGGGAGAEVRGAGRKRARDE